MPKLRAELGRGRGEERGTFTRVHTEAQGRPDVWNIPESGCFECCGMEVGGSDAEAVNADHPAVCEPCRALPRSRGM